MVPPPTGIQTAGTLKGSGTAGVPIGMNQLVTTFGGMFVAVAWILPLCWLAADWTVTLIAVGLLYALLMTGISVHRRRRLQIHRFFMIETVILCILEIVLVGFRWTHWMTFYRETAFYDPAMDLPAWLVMFIILVVSGTLFTFHWVEDKKKNPRPVAAGQR